MANPEHLAIIKQGVEIWNQWRDDYPEIEPDLSQCCLKELDLRKVLFNNTNLREAILVDNNFREAKFYKANLNQATLGRSILDQAYVVETNLERAELRETSLVACDLSRSPNTEQGKEKIVAEAIQKVENNTNLVKRVFSVSEQALFASLQEQFISPLQTAFLVGLEDWQKNKQ